MNILFVTATEAEILPLKNLKSSHKTDFLIAGIGVPATVFSLTKHLCTHHYDLIINVGIAGAFAGHFKVGEVVQIISDTFSDLGIDNRGTFIPLTQSGLLDANSFPYHNHRLRNPLVLPNIPQANAITAGTTHGSQPAISQIETLWNADIESMEGAAVAYVCLSLCQTFYQIRAISNIVEIRNRDNWNIPLALKNLTLAINTLLVDYLK